MCTVTYIPYGSSRFVLTSNRDESRTRETQVPSLFSSNGLTILAPLDTVSGGTWIAASADTKVTCLLNGGFQNHIKLQTYDKSRGQILLESLHYGDVARYFHKVRLHSVEPFTLVSVDLESDIGIRLTESVWDGQRTHIRQLDPEVPAIWSSATLYAENERMLRRSAFEEWQSNKTIINRDDILNFHRVMCYAGDKVDMLGTVSVTQVHAGNNGVHMRYLDCAANVWTEGLLLSDFHEEKS